jgi:hypothetical protein
MITKTIQSICYYIPPYLLATINKNPSTDSTESPALNEWRTVQKDFHLNGAKYGDQGETIFAGQKIRLVKKGNPSDFSVWEVESPPSFLNKRLERFFSHSPYKLSPNGVEYTEGIFFDKNGTTLNGFWNYLNELKKLTVQIIPEELWEDVKKECDDLFRQASDGAYTICPSWILGGFGNAK